MTSLTKGLSIASLMIAWSVGVANAQAGGTFSVFPNRQTIQVGIWYFNAFVVSRKDSKIWWCSGRFDNNTTRDWTGYCSLIPKMTVGINTNTEIASKPDPLGDKQFPELWFIDTATGQVHVCFYVEQYNQIEKCYAFPPLP